MKCDIIYNISYIIFKAVISWEITAFFVIFYFKVIICEGNGFFIYYFIFFEKEKKYEKNNKHNGRTFKNFRFRR